MKRHRTPPKHRKKIFISSGTVGHFEAIVKELNTFTMYSLSQFKILAFALAAVIIVVATAPFAEANHDWDGYHWARTQNPFTVSLGDNVSSGWDAALRGASSDWSQSSVLNTAVVSGKSSRSCRPTAGRVEVCNGKYGANGWLGIASIWTNGEHITAGTVKLNDTYFSQKQYNTAAWKNLVMCQEVGHAFGLDHQDENFANGNLGTCMDYTNSPESNQHPNEHDYDMLEDIYSHTDSSTTVGKSSRQAASAEINDIKDLGREVRRSVRSSVYERDLGGDQKVVTHVFWIDPQEDGHEEHDH